MQRPRSMWWRLKRWKAVIKTWLPALFPSRSMLDWYWVLRWALTPCQNLPGRSDMLKLDRWWILHHPQIGLISGAVLLDEKLWYCRIHSLIHKHIACLLTDITLVFFVFTVLSYTQWTTKSWTLFKSLFSWYRCPTSRSDWWTTCKIMQDLNDDIADINEADSRTTVTPMDNCSIQFSRQRQVHGCSW